MVGHHAPVWYRLYWLIEGMVDLLKTRTKRCLKKDICLTPEDELSVVGKVVVITGANSGVGKYAATEMAKRGAVVVMGCRDLTRGETARQEILKSSDLGTELYKLDLSNLDSVRKFAREVLEKHSVIDILINNAGMGVNHTVQQKSKEGWDLCMLTNHPGHFLLTNLLINGILASDLRRVVAVSSSLLIPANLDPNDLMMENGRNLGMWNSQPYQNSKLAMSLCTKFLGKRQPSIKTYSICPGIADTAFFGNLERRTLFDGVLSTCLYIGLEKVEHGAATLLLCALGKIVEGDSGAFFRFGKRIKGIEKMLTDELAEQVWNASEKICGLA